MVSYCDLTCQKLIDRVDSCTLSLCALFMNESLFARSAIHVGLVRYCRMQEAQKRDSEAAELAAKMEKEKKEMQVSTIIFQETNRLNRSGVSSILLKSLRSVTTFPSDIQLDAFYERHFRFGPSSDFKSPSASPLIFTHGSFTTPYSLSQTASKILFNGEFAVLIKLSLF